jgi:hypothetical protein
MSSHVADITERNPATNACIWALSCLEIDGKGELRSKAWLLVLGLRVNKKASKPIEAIVGHQVHIEDPVLIRDL